MPNIEIYGFKDGSGDETVILTAVAVSLLKTKYKDEVVITTIPSRCENLNGDLMPFLRICDTNTERMEDIARVLRQIKPGLDIELLALARFYEKG
jgi:hypothetical protein